jgi:hypothetical protein
MENAYYKDLKLTEINQLFGLSPNNDFLSYIEKYDNDVPLMDTNDRFTAYFRNSEISYVIVFSSDALSKIRNRKEEVSPILRLIETREGYTLQEKLDKAKKKFNSAIIKYYEVFTTNVFVNYLDDEESELYEKWDNQREESYPDIYDDIPYLGLPEDEQETGHWNID